MTGSLQWSLLHEVLGEVAKAQKMVFAVSANRSCLLAAIRHETGLEQDWNTGTAISQTVMAQTNKTSWAHPKPSARAEPPCLSGCYSLRSGWFAAFSFKTLYSSMQVHSKWAMIRSQSSRLFTTISTLFLKIRAKSVRNVHYCSGWQETFFWKDGKEEFLNTDFLREIRIGSQRCYEKPASLLKSVLAKRQFLLLQEVRIFQCGLPWRIIDFYTLNDIVRGWNYYSLRLL